MHDYIFTITLEWTGEHGPCSATWTGDIGLPSVHDDGQEDLVAAIRERHPEVPADAVVDSYGLRQKNPSRGTPSFRGILSGRRR